MSNSIKVPVVYVVLKKPRTVAAVLSLAQAIEAAMAANAVTFPSPVPTMVQFSSDIAGANAAESTAKTRTKGAAAARNAKLAIVLEDMSQLRGYVQVVANQAPTNAAAIAASAGMLLRKQPVRSQNDVNVTQAVSGSVKVMARVGTKQKQSHEWQYSVDGGKTWLALPPTTQAKTTITGITPGVTVEVQHRAITGTGLTPWSDAASLMVS